MKKIWKDKNDIEIKNGDIINSPNGNENPVVFVEDWDDIGISLFGMIIPLSEWFEENKKYEIIGKGKQKTIVHEKSIKMTDMPDMPEYKRDYGKSPGEIIKNILK